MRPPTAQRTDRLGEGLVALCAALGLLAFLLGHGLAETPEPGPTFLERWLPAALLLLLALLRRPLLPWLGRHPSLEALFLALQIAPLAVWPLVTFAAWFPPALALLQVNLWVRPRRLETRAWSLALAPVQVLAGMAAAPHGIWLVLLPTTWLATSAALVFLSRSATRARWRSSAPRPFQRQEPGSAEDEAPPQGRLASAAVLALVLGLTTVTAYPLMVAIPRPAFDDGRDRPGFTAESGETTETGARAFGQGRPASDSFPGALRPGGNLGELDYETVMTVGAHLPGAEQGPPRDVGPLYLRALCLDHFTATGLRSTAGRPVTRRDGDDGLEDGWIELGSEAGPARLHLEIRQNALRVPPTDDVVLFAVHPLLSLRLPEVRDDPDRFLALPTGVEVAEFETALRVADPWPDPARLRGRRASHPDGRFLQLPEEGDDLDWLARRARELTAGSADDLERVQRVLRHFQEDFHYSTRTRDVPGLEGIVSFMRREQGHCTSFAAAAVLLLRTLELPARVATGFLAEAADPESGRYLVTRSNGHAWIEVHFEGLGWQTFEATPSARRREALRAAEAGEDDGLASWFAELQGDLRAWARSGADETYLGPLQATLADAPRALRATLERRPWLALPLLLPAALLGLWVRRVLRRQGGGGRRRRSREQDLLHQILAALAHRGHRRSAHQSLREFVGGLELEEETQRELAGLVPLFERASFAGRPLEPQEVERVRLWTRGLAASS